MKTLYRFNGSIRSNLNEVKPIVDETLFDLKNFIQCENSLFDIKLILDELVINSVLHGNENNFLKNVYLSVCLRTDEVEIRVKDEGEGISYDFDSYNINDLKSTGRGLLLVRALTDKFIMHGNEVIAVKHLK